MFCEKCGFKNKKDSIFCEQCGNNLTVPYVPTKKGNAPFTEEEGNKIIFCESCGKQNLNDSAFCEHCGTDLTVASKSVISSSKKEIIKDKNIKPKKEKPKKENKIISKQKITILIGIIAVLGAGLFLGINYFKDKKDNDNKLLIHVFVGEKAPSSLEEFFDVIKDEQIEIKIYPIWNNARNLNLYKDAQKVIDETMDSEVVPGIIVGNKHFYGLNDINKKAIENEIKALKESGKVIDVVQNVVENKGKDYQRDVFSKNNSDDNNKNQETPKDERNDKEIIAIAINNFAKLKSYKAKETLDTKMVGNDYKSTSIFDVSVDKENKKYYYTASHENADVYYYYIDVEVTPNRIYSKRDSDNWYYDTNHLGHSDPDYIFSRLIPFLSNTDNISLVSNKDNIRTYNIVVPKENFADIDIDLSYHVTEKFRAVADLKATIKISNGNLIYIDYEVSDLIQSHNDISFIKSYDHYRTIITFSEFNNVVVTIPNEVVKNAEKTCDFFEDDC